MGDMEVTAYAYVVLQHNAYWYFKVGMFVSLGAFFGWNGMRVMTRFLATALDWVVNPK